MKPGRELDALVAEKVMGIKTEYYSGCLVEKVSAHFEQRVYPLDYLIPEYSTDISAAWKVVERIEKRFVLQKVFLPHSDQPSFSAHFSNEKVIDFWREGSVAPTASHAICLAALKTIGTELGNA